MQVEEAQFLAVNELAHRRETSVFWRNVKDLSEPHVVQETSEFWVFFARSESLAEASHAPGGMFITVDKQTGRIWNRDEIEAYYTAKSYQPIAA